MSIVSISLEYVTKSETAGSCGVVFISLSYAMFNLLMICQTFVCLFFKVFYKFIYFYFWLNWVFVAACGHSLVVARGLSSCGAWA